jgi:cytochrome d ubiquinol oxidase subunit II
MLGATAVCLFPALLPAIEGAAGPSITAYDGGGTREGLRMALGWWGVGIPLVIGYFVVLFRMHRGKVAAASGREGY